ncbi:protein kinase [Pontiella sp.]|uniref:protein kinase domain-containing protein n=1 Tax=Pontiella sp. TaxID=2837462 RepID=UPI0035634DFA
MTDGDSKELEQKFSERMDTLASFYHTEELSMSEQEIESLTPILNSLKKDDARYRELKKIAEGGEKKISLVHDRRLDRRIAMARAVRNKSPQDLEQFLREARLTANLAHPNIMPVYNMGLDEQGEPFFSMELIPGDSLKSIIRNLQKGEGDYRKRYPLETLLNIFVKVCDAIAYAHSRNVLHLDIKPDNIRVGEFGEVLVCDWGLARVQYMPEEQDGDESTELDGDVLNDMTLSGTMKGTPGFMAPEQTLAYGGKTEKTDIYALGALLYNLLTYELPVEGDSANEVVQNTRAGKIISPRRRRPDRRVPKSLVAVILKALALDPEARYDRVLDLRRDIQLFLTGHPTRAEHAGPITRTSLLLQRHSRLAFLLIFFLILLASVIGGNLVAISREKAEAVAQRKNAEANFQLFIKEQRQRQQLGENLGEAVSYTVRSRDFVNAASMIQLLETGLKENVDTVKRQNLYEQKGILHFVLQEFNIANECFAMAGESRRIGQLRELSEKYAQIKPVDKRQLTDKQLAELFYEAKTANQMTLYYVYYHHMRRRPSRAKAEEYEPLAAAVLDKLNYSSYAKKNGLKMTYAKDGNTLDLSDSPYTVFSINIIGVYRRNVLAPLGLKSLDLSNTGIESLYEIRGLRLEELKLANVRIENRSKNTFISQINPLRLSRLVINVDDYPEDTLAALRSKMEVVDADAKKKAEALKKAEEARRRSAALERKRQEEAKRKAEEEAKRKAEQERLKAEAEKQRLAEEARKKAEADARRKAEETARKAEEARRKAEAEKKKLEEELARWKAAEAQAKEEARQKALDATLAAAQSEPATTDPLEKEPVAVE